MLVKITKVCDMGCTHCMEDALPEGVFSAEHMTMDTYRQVLDYIMWTGYPIIMISGGEPTKNPNVLKMIEMAKRKDIQPFLLTNGTFLENSELKEAILGSLAYIQITNDPRYYPKKVPVIEKSGISYEHHLRVVSPFGRAVGNNLETNRVSPLCFNLRSICRSVKNFKETIALLRSKGKMCTPSINIDGSINAGETKFCSKVGSVFDTGLDKLVENICTLKCDRCGLVKNLSTPQKDAIGES